jgi:hypothetical protein
LGRFRNIAAVIDDRIHAFACRAVLAGRTSLRPSLLQTQVAEALGGSDPDAVLQRILAHCGDGGLLVRVLRAECPACAAAVELRIGASTPRDDAVIACGRCGGSLRLSGLAADEALLVNEQFCEYLRLVFGKPPGASVGRTT